MVFQFEISYLLSAKYKNTINGTEDASFLWAKKIDVGLVVGTHYALTNKLSFELRYIHGFISVTDYDKLLEGFDRFGVVRDSVMIRESIIMT